MRIRPSVMILGCVLAASGGCKKSAADTEGDGGSAKNQTAIYVARGESTPACSADNSGQVAYFEAESSFRYCGGTSWDAVDLKGEKGDPGTSGASKAILVKTTPEAPGAECFYGGINYDLGTDADADGQLDAGEESGSFLRCDSSLHARSKDFFDSYFYSIAAIGVRYTFAGDCLDQQGTSETFYSGTGWALAEDTFVTNEHVVEKTTLEDCDGDGNLETTFNLAEIKVFLPKTSITLEQWRSRGASQSPLLDTNGDEFDILDVTQVDRRASASSSPSLPADRVDVAFLKVDGHGRTPLVISENTQESPAQGAMRIGEQLVLIGHPLGGGSTLSIGSLMAIQSCREWWQTLPWEGFSDEDELCPVFYMVPDSRTMLVSNYADHGMSGSPAIDRFGNVVGIYTWTSSPADNHDTNSVQLIEYVRPWIEMTRVWTGFNE